MHHDFGIAKLSCFLELAAAGAKETFDDLTKIAELAILLIHNES
jgi:hypothetical protein